MLCCCGCAPRATMSPGPSAPKSRLRPPICAAVASDGQRFFANFRKKPQGVNPLPPPFVCTAAAAAAVAKMPPQAAPAGDRETQAQFVALLKTLGLPQAKLDLMLKLPLEKKREMLQMYKLHQRQSTKETAKTARDYAKELKDDPGFEQLIHGGLGGICAVTQ